MMRAGRLYDQIEIQSASHAISDAGTPVTTWTTKARPRAEVLQRETREYVRAQGAEDEAAIVLRIRWQPGITTADRVLFDGRAYNLREVSRTDRRRALDLRCMAYRGDQDG